MGIKMKMEEHNRLIERVVKVDSIQSFKGRLDKVMNRDDSWTQVQYWTFAAPLNCYVLKKKNKLQCPEKVFNITKGSEQLDYTLACFQILIHI